MNPDLTLPIITSLGWLVLVASGLASYRLGWGRLVTMALVWIAIFGGLYLVVEWFMIARSTTEALV